MVDETHAIANATGGKGDFHAYPGHLFPLSSVRYGLVRYGRRLGRFQLASALVFVRSWTFTVPG